MIRPTRGEHNNNPGNLERNATVWQGMTVDQPDARFVTFTTPFSGIRALAKTLLAYYHLHQCDTVEQIISRWAPPSENATHAYVNHVAECIGATASDRLNLDDPNVLESLVKAIITHENGRCIYEDELLAEAVDAALGVT